MLRKGWIYRPPLDQADALVRPAMGAFRGEETPHRLVTFPFMDFFQHDRLLPGIGLRVGLRVPSCLAFMRLVLAIVGMSSAAVFLRWQDG